MLKKRTAAGVLSSFGISRSASSWLQMVVPSAAIIQLSESATKMKAQVEYLQGKVMTDAQTINGVSDEK